MRQQIERAGAAAVRAAGGRAIPSANYHITLAFLGNVSVEHLDNIVSAARRVVFNPFTISLDRTGYWPRPQVVWLKPDQCPAQLSQLEHALWGELSPLGFRADSRTYKPHVSLARKVPGGLGSVLDEPVQWPVKGFALVRSETLSGGAVYTLLDQFPARDRN